MTGSHDPRNDAASQTASVLFIDIRVPDPRRDAASIRSIQILSYLGARRRVDLFAVTGTATAAQFAVLADRGVRLRGAGSTEDIRRYLEQEGEHLRLVVLAWSRVATLFLDLVRACAPRARIVFDTHDVNHVREFRHARAIGSQPLLRRALVLKEHESAAIRAADRTIAITEVDQATFAALVPQARIDVVRMWCEVGPVQLTPTPREPIILYAGHYQTAANIDAAERLAKEILPAVRCQIPGTRLDLAGSDPPDSLVTLASDAVLIPGWEEDLTPHFQRASVFAAPMRIGSGLKGKILQAMAHRVPIVASAVAVEGTGLVAGRDYVAAESAADFADGIVRLLTDPKRRHEIAEAGACVLRARFSRKTVETQMDGAFRDYLDQLSQ